jgi:cell surface protein SprA
MVSITEQFAPLFSLDATWNNSLLSKFEYKRSRDLSLSLANNQLTEITSKEIVLGLGYRIKNVKFSIKKISGGKKKSLKSDLNIKADLSIRNNETVLRKLVENVNQVSAGQQVISINSSADYQINEKFVIKLFFDKIITNPFVSSQFPNANTNAGISLRFTLAP